MIVKKIISDGQTGASIASLDAALLLGIDYGGCLPKGRSTENGALDAKYLGMEELDVQDETLIAAQNIRNSEGTVVFSHGELLGIARFAHESAIQLSKPVLHLNLDVLSENKALDLLSVWILENQIGVINVTGTLESEDQYIYDEVYAIVKSLLQMQNSAAMLQSPTLTFSEKTQSSEPILDKVLPKRKKGSSKKKNDKSSETVATDAPQILDKDTLGNPVIEQPFSLSPESALLESLILEAQQDSSSLDFDLTLPEESQENASDTDQTFAVDTLSVPAEIIADKISEEEGLEVPSSCESEEMPREQEVTSLSETAEAADILEIEEEEIRDTGEVPSSQETTIPIVVEAFEIISDEEPTVVAVFDPDKTTVIEEVRAVEAKDEEEQEVIIPESSENADSVIERREEEPVTVARQPFPQHVQDDSTVILSQNEEFESNNAVSTKRRNYYLAAALSVLVLIALVFMVKALRQSPPQNDLTKSPAITANKNEKPRETVNNAALAKNNKAISNVETTPPEQKTKESVPISHPQNGQVVSNNDTTPISEEPNRRVSQDTSEQNTGIATEGRSQHPVTDVQGEEGIRSAATDSSPAKVDLEVKHRAGLEVTSESVTPSMGADPNGKGQHLSSEISGKEQEDKKLPSATSENSSSAEEPKGNGTVSPSESLTSDDKGEKKQTVQPKKPTNEPNRCASLYKKMSLGTVLTEAEMSYLANKCK